MMLISRMISSREEPLPLEPSRMYLAAYTFLEERSVTFFTTPNFPLLCEITYKFSLLSAIERFNAS